MTAKERMKYWEAWERQRLIIERKYKAKIRKVLLNRVKEVQAAIRLGGVEYGKQSLNMDLLNTELVNIYIQIYKETSIRFANITYRELRLEVRKGASFGFNEEWAREAARFLAIEGIPLISTVTGNMREWILAVIGQAVGEGLELSLSMEDLIDMIIGRVGNYMEDKSRYWAERIARTETVRGANFGAMQGARKHDFLVKKVWIAADDKRTRHSHRDLDNQVRGLEEPFYNYENIMQPGDPKASPENTINCRCAVAFEAQRDSNGKVIRK
jgi:uncharacterized protein with gpF-like domain